MEQSIKELIELSTSSGNLKPESRELIYQKAHEKGISKEECDIYIDSSLHSSNKEESNIKVEKSYRGYWFILVGLFDFFWGARCMKNEYTEDYGIFGLISGTLFILIGIFLLGYFKKENTNKIVKLLTHQYAYPIYLTMLILINLGINLNRFNFFESIVLSLFIAVLPWFLAKNKKYTKTKNVLFGNLFFWVIAIIIPRYTSVSLIQYMIEAFRTVAPFYQYAFVFLALLALISDYFGTENKKTEVINRFTFLFNHKIIPLLFFIPFVILFAFSALTKHNISENEWKKFNEKNGQCDGYWYFINNDTTEVNQLNLSFSGTPKGDGGEIELKYNAYLTSNTSMILNKYDISFSTKEDYDYEIQYPIKFENILEISSVLNGDLKGLINTSDGKKINFTARKERAMFDALIRAKQERLNTIVDIQQSTSTDVMEIAPQLQSDGYFTVSAEKCYFYSAPNVEFRKKSFLVKDQTAHYTQIQDGFVLASFENERGQKTEGWIEISDIIIK